jgi:hypothetical protein
MIHWRGPLTGSTIEAAVSHSGRESFDELFEMPSITGVHASLRAVRGHPARRYRNRSLVRIG